MKCDSKVWLKTVAGSGLALAVAYFTFPAVHALILASAPILLALICPVAMLLMMATMNASKKDDGAKSRAGRAPVSASAAADFVAGGAWAHPAIPGRDVAAVYLTPTSTKGATLIDVRSDTAEVVQVHDMTMDAGVMRMRERDRLLLPAGQAVWL